MAIEKRIGAYSAYAIAVENGFEGTEEEWLKSLRYDHSDEFGALAKQVQENAESAAASAQAAELSKQSSAQSAAAAQSAANASASKAGEASASASAAAASAQNAADSAEDVGNQLDQAQAAAATATQKAGEAAQSAEYAHMAVPEVADSDNGKVMTVIGGKWAAVDPLYPTNNWNDIQRIVRMGAAPRYFPVGYEFVTHDSTEDTDIIWRVVGYDTIKAADESLTHTMILETKYAYSHKEGYARTIMYGFKDALYYAETGLTAGTYHFTLPNTYPSDGGGKTYSFTLTQPVPVGGLVDFEWFHGQQAINSLIKTYASPMDIIPIETVSLTEGDGGTYLGTADGASNNMNIDSRVRYGSNNYAQGVVRKWLNTAQTDPFVWATPETKFNRFPKLPGLTLENRAGFLSGLPEDFLAAVQTAVVPNKSNATFETASLDGTIYELDTMYHTYDKFFLLHSGEISEDYEGFEVLEYYKDATDVDRIKYSKNGTAVNYWLRSCNPTQPAWASSIIITGAFNSAGTTNIMAVCPACIIA